MPSKRMVELAFNRAVAFEREGKMEEAEKWLNLALGVEERLEEEEGK